jgi:hypothetical protein
VLSVIPDPSLPITVELQLIVNSFAGMSYGPSISDVQALNTGSLNIDVLTPGATIESASGYNYSAVAAVPEPAEVTLLISGLCVLVSRRKCARCLLKPAPGHR